MTLLSRCYSVLLLLLVPVFLAGALWIAYRVVFLGLNEPSITAAALLATVSGLFLTAQRQLADRNETTSRFYLDQYQAGFDKAYEILEAATPGDPMFRAKWIASARILATAHEMYARISVSAHRDVALMNVPHQSQRFMQFFEKTTAYYYGVGTAPATGAGLDQLARASTAGSGSSISTLRYIPEKVIKTVWDSIQYPKGYKDVLGEGFSDGDRLFLPDGLLTYLDHRERWHSAAGELHERAHGEPRD